MSGSVAYDDERGANVGWAAGALVIVAVMAVGAYFWFSHHP